MSVRNFITYNIEALKISSTSLWRHWILDNPAREKQPTSHVTFRTPLALFVKTHIIRIIPASRLPCRIHRQRLGPSGSRRLRDSRFSSKCSKSVKRPSWNEKYENPGVKKPSGWLCLLPKHKRRDTLSLLSLLLLHHRPHLHVTFVTSPFRICNSQRLAYLFKEHKNFILSDHFAVSRKYKKRKLKRW